MTHTLSMPSASRRAGTHALLHASVPLSRTLQFPARSIQRISKPPKPTHAFSRRINTGSVHRPTQRTSPLLSRQVPRRKVSTETRAWVYESFKGAARVTAYLWAGVFFSLVAWQGYQHDMQEKATPTPHEWSLITRYWMREAWKARTPDQSSGLEVPEWTLVAKSVRKALKRLEDVNTDGQHLKPALGEGEGDILVEGVGRAGPDVTGCAEPWRRGYFEALMLAGAAAEHVDGFVVDKSRSDMVFPPQVVIGPNNPTPQPMPFNSSVEAPREENCEVFFDQPQKYYLKVLTAAGFTSEQRLQAALAYADWLDFKELSNSARDMYDWAMDIADAAYIERGEAAPIDRTSGTLRPGTATVSTNALRTIGALAEHLARSGDTQAALPAFLTTLRILGQLPGSEKAVGQYPAASSNKAGVTGGSTTSSPSWVPSFLQKIIQDVNYPYPPRSGDLAAERDADTACKEATIMAHIGEILFVSSPSSLPSSLISSSSTSFSPAHKNNAVKANAAQLAGLAWTQRAVDAAEYALREMTGRNAHEELLLAGSSNSGSFLDRARKAAEKQARAGEKQTSLQAYAQCLSVAVSNWQKMTGRLAEQERALQAERARRRMAKAGGHLEGEQDAIGAAVPDVAASRSMKAAAATRQSSEDDAGVTGWASWLWRGVSGGSKNGGDGPGAADNDLGFWMEETRKVEERKFAIRKLLREERLRFDL